MYGLALLFYMLVYVVAVGLLLYKIKPWWVRALILITAVLIPNADDWYYRRKLANYCERDAGVRVYEHASRKEGLLVEPQAEGDKFYAKKYLVAFIESPIKVGGKVSGYWRTDHLSGGISEPYKVQQSLARYEKRRMEMNTGTYIEDIQQIVDRQSGAVLGEFKILVYYGGWYPKSLIGSGGLVAGCGNGGQVLSHYEWQRQDTTGYSINEVVKQIFSKE